MNAAGSRRRRHVEAGFGHLPLFHVDLGSLDLRGRSPARQAATSASTASSKPWTRPWIYIRRPLTTALADVPGFLHNGDAATLVACAL